MGSHGSEKTPKGWGHQKEITVNPLSALGPLENIVEGETILCYPWAFGRSWKKWTDMTSTASSLLHFPTSHVKVVI